jgi:hypothetical protein
MGQNANSRGSKQSTVKVKGAMEVRPGRQLGVEAGSAEKVEGDDSLFDETIPQVQGKVFFDAA